MHAGRHEAPQPTDALMAAVVLAPVGLLTVVVVLAIVDRP